MALPQVCAPRRAVLLLWPFAITAGYDPARLSAWLPGSLEAEENDAAVVEAGLMTPKDFFKLAEKHQSQMVDLKFVDMLGSWQHCSFPIDTWNEGTFEEGLGFDGSSIRGWKGIHE